MRDDHEPSPTTVPNPHPRRPLSLAEIDCRQSDSACDRIIYNHPSGDPTPSRADIEMTKEVARAAATLGIAVHDHIIIARDRHASLKGMGLM